MINEFINICKKNQKELLIYLNSYLLKYYSKDKIESTNSYIYVQGDIPVLLVAHLDTVHSEKPKNIWYNNKGCIKADEGIGGDDRCGVFIITNLIKESPRPSLLFTTDEEIGGVGATEFCSVHNSLDVNCMIELDRRGKNDVIRYSDENDELIKIFECLGYKEDFGSFTDISILSPHFNISGVNLSVGYYNAHTKDEYVDVNHMKSTEQRVKKFLKNESNYNKKYEYKEEFRDPYYCHFGIQVCDFCNKPIRRFDDLIETPDGICCNECFKAYQNFYEECPNCGSLKWKDDICFDCGYYYE